MGNLKKAVGAALVVGLAGGACAAKAATQSHITKAGKACCVVVLPDDATGGEQYAARELKEHIRQIAGVDLPQTSESLYTPASGPCISIGRTALSRKHVTDENIAAFGDEGYRVFCRDGDAFFVGGRRRGVMYAVYEFLESLGVRWYSPGYTVIPKAADVLMPSRPCEFTPKFWYRCQWWNNGATLEWLARMRVNGNTGQTPRMPESMGGCVMPMYNCHSFEKLVPAGEYLGKHPAWFAVKDDGKRSGGELCLTNPELRDFVTSKVLSDLATAPEPVENYWVSQNDGGASGCFCEKCTAERVAHGGKNRWSANIVGFVSYVAEKVKPEFPKVHIKTLAYSYTNDAPQDMTTPDNVLVEICGNFKPGAADAHTSRVASWFKVAKSISVYTYGGSNFGYWWPYPNMFELGMQYPRALAAGVTAFYVQGTALGKGSGLVDLRAYLSARLSWDPSRDVKKEIREFCKGFYGPAGKYIIEYCEWYEDYVKQHKMALYESWGDSEAWRVWVTRDAMARAETLFQKALTAAKDNPVYLKHVRQAYLEVLWAEVMLDLKPAPDNKPVLLPGADPSVVRARAKLFGEIMRENGYDKWAEHLPYVPGENLIDAAAK